MHYRLFVAFILTALLCSIGCIQRKTEKITKKDSPVTAELTSALNDLTSYIHDRPTDTSQINAYARQLRLRVYKFLAQALIVEPADLYRAAYLIQAGDLTPDADRFLLARQLAIECAEHGHQNGKLLAAICLDRYLVAAGQPQKYGTQYTLSATGWPLICPYDTLTTDSERVAWNVPPLDSLKANPLLLSNRL